jgi:hypothetical protein
MVLEIGQIIIMLFTKKYLVLAFLSGIIFIQSCNTSEHSKSDVELAMKHYDNLILKLDADSISMLYTPDGNLGDIAVGRDSIKKFLSTFKNVKVLSQTSTTNSINIIHDTAIQKGSYTQIDLIAEKDTVKVKGEYTTQWQWIKNEGWHIKHMVTKPIK